MNFDVVTKINLNKTTLKKLNQIPDKILYEIARETLDLSLTSIPLSHGDLRRTSMATGVTDDGNKSYHIGSYTDYASKVWNYNDSTTNWSEPGTHSKWYNRTLKEKKDVILKGAIERNKI